MLDKTSLSVDEMISYIRDTFNCLSVYHIERPENKPLGDYYVIDFGNRLKLLFNTMMYMFSDDESGKEAIKRDIIKKLKNVGYDIEEKTVSYTKIRPIRKGMGI